VVANPPKLKLNIRMGLLKEVELKSGFKSYQDLKSNDNLAYFYGNLNKGINRIITVSDLLSLKGDTINRDTFYTDILVD
jgi:hypothetical protein